MKDNRDRTEYRKKYWEENKELLKPRRREYWKKYSKKNKEKLKKKAKEYYHKSKDKMKVYCEKNKEKIKARHKTYYLKNKERLNKNNRKNNKELYQKNLLSWKGFIPLETNCQICGKKLYFGQTNRQNAIHFDHKKESITIKETPCSWLGRHPRNLKNEEIWKDNNFGMLCGRCNSSLPTNNRVVFVKNVVKYIGGI